MSGRPESSPSSRARASPRTGPRGPRNRPVDDGATLEDLREAVNFNEETMRTARRVLGGAHPLTKIIERNLSIVQDLAHRRGLSKK